MRILMDVAPVNPVEGFAMMAEEILPWLGIGVAAMFVIAALWIAHLTKKNKK